MCILGGEALGDVNTETGKSLERQVKTVPTSHLAVYRNKRGQPCGVLPEAPPTFHKSTHLIFFIYKGLDCELVSYCC